MRRVARRHPFILSSLLLLLAALLFLNRALFPPEGQVLGGHDLRGYYLPLYVFIRRALSEGHLPLWMAQQFNGYPVFVDPQMGLFYPPVYLPVLLPAHIGVSWYMLLHIWAAGTGMVLFARSQKAGWLPALLAGLSYAFSGMLAGRLWAGHTIVYAIYAWIPWSLAGLAWGARRGGLAPGLLAGVPLALALLAGHFPSMLYVGLIWGLFVLYLLLSPSERNVAARTVLAQALLAGLVALGLSAVQLLPFLQFTLASSRVAVADYNFATDYSFPPAHLITLIIPDYFGEPGRVGYWSVPTFEELTYYAGILPLIGLVLALARPTRRTWFYLSMIVLGLLLAFGRYGFLYRLVYDLLPPFRVVRAPGRAALLYVVAVIALLATTLTHWQQRPQRERLQQLLRWTMIVGLMAGVAALAATGAVFAAQHPTDTSGRLWHQLGGLSLALVLWVGGTILLGRYLSAGENSRGRTLFSVLLVLFVVTDLWLFSRQMVRLESTLIDPVWQEAATIVEPGKARVLPWGLPLFSQSGALQVGMNSVFGYSAVELERHIALTSSVPDPRSTAYDVLGVRYVIANGPQEQFTEGEQPLTLVGQQGSAWVYERSRVLPVARLVTQAEVIEDPAAAVARLHQPDFDPATTVIVEETPPCEVAPGADPGTATIVEMEDGYWQIETASEQPALLVLAETAYPGWQVTVDGEQAEPLTAYTTLRAVCVPAGQHTIEWRFAPTIHLWGGAISLVSLLGVIAAAVAVLRRRNKRTEESL